MEEELAALLVENARESCDWRVTKSRQSSYHFNSKPSLPLRVGVPPSPSRRPSLSESDLECDLTAATKGELVDSDAFDTPGPAFARRARTRDGGEPTRGAVGIGVEIANECPVFVGVAGAFT